MKIAVVGGGAIGLLTSFMLSKAGYEITLYTRTIAQRDQILEKGITYKTSEESVSLKIDCKVFYEGVQADICIVTVKYYDLESVIFSNKIDTKTLVLLQNGYNHIKLANQLDFDNIYIGIVEHGAQRTNIDEVYHTGFGNIRFGLLRGMDENLNSIITNEIPGFPMLLVKEWEKIVLDKLVANIVINPLTALLNVENGEIIDNKYFKKLANNIFLECCEIFNIQERNDLWEYVYSVIFKTKNNKSSMLKDVLNNKKTEIDTILGEALYIAEKNNINALHIKFIYNCIKGIEARE